MMPRFSRDKGARGEREWRDVLIAHGFTAERGCQRSGGPDTPDVECWELPIHWEVKRTEKLNVHQAVAQAISDAGDLTPVVAHRRNRDEWLCTMRASDLLEMIRRARDGR